MASPRQRLLRTDQSMVKALSLGIRQLQMPRDLVYWGFLVFFVMCFETIGGWHCLAVDDQGRAYAWGGNEYDQSGEESEQKDDTGRPLKRNIIIPQRCASKLSICQVITDFQ